LAATNLNAAALDFEKVKLPEWLPNTNASDSAEEK
jgi:hypothetical protein